MQRNYRKLKIDFVYENDYKLKPRLGSRSQNHCHTFACGFVSCTLLSMKTIKPHLAINVSFTLYLMKEIFECQNHILRPNREQL